MNPFVESAEAERQYHEVANIFPLMQGAEYEGLKEDIRTNGLLEPVWLHPESHTIVDGRNRHRACVELGISPKFRYWDGKGSLVGFVVSLNLKRRHLTPSQASMIGADILPMLEEEAHKKQLSTLKQNAATVEANLPQRSGDRAQQARDQAAAIIGVSPRSIQDAKTVRKQGSDELVRAVKEGHVAVSTAAIIAQAPPEDQIVIVAQGPKQIVEASKKIRTKKSAEKRAERVEKINRISQGNKPLTEVVNRLYPVIYADPPWEYDHSETESREIGNQYPTMSVDKICSLPIDKVAAPDCVLILWATSPKLLDAMHVIESWGFTYKTCMVWDKEVMGMGYYARQQHELLLFATKGSLPVPEDKNRPPSVVRIRRDKKHSAKPEEFYGIIEKMYPEYDKIELFARNRRDGWEAWGNQA